MTRRDERAEALREAGAEPAVCDVFDAEGLRAAVAAAAPEVVVHELTDLPPALDPRKRRSSCAGNDRIRTEGTRNLVAAAVAAARGGSWRRASRSPTRRRATRVKDEEEPLWDDAPEPWSRSIDALRALEDAVTEADGHRGPGAALRILLRARAATRPDGSLGARGAPAPLPGASARAPASSRSSTSTTPPRRPSRRSSAARPGSTTSSTTTRRRCATGCRPTRRRSGEAAAAAAGLLGADGGGKFTAAMATELRGASNEKAKRELGWQPRYAELAPGIQGGARLSVWPSADGSLRPRAALPAQLLHAVLDRAHRLVAQLRAGAGDVDRALLRREPVGEARDRRASLAGAAASRRPRGRGRDAPRPAPACCGRAPRRPACRAAR